MMEYSPNRRLGVVEDGATTGQFHFSSKSPISDEFVKVSIGEAQYLLARVVEISSVNPAFGTKSARFFFTEEVKPNLVQRGYYRVEALPIGVYDCQKRDILSTIVPPLPGSYVVRLAKEEIESIVGRGTHPARIDVGATRSDPTIRVTFDYGKFFRSHSAAIGQTGCGKSHLVTRLVLELRRLRYHDPANCARVPVIFDVTGEFTRSQGVFSKFLTLSDLNCSQIRYPFFSPADFDFFDDLCGFQDRDAENLLRLVKGVSSRDKDLLGAFSQLGINLSHVRSTGALARCLAQVIDYVAQYVPKGGKKHTYQGLPLKDGRTDTNAILKLEKEYELSGLSKGALSKLHQCALKIQVRAANLQEEHRHGLILSFDSDASLWDQQVALKYWLRKLLLARAGGEAYPPLIFFLEEAHNFVPSITNTVCKKEIIKVAREGRKLGISLCVISQRPRRIDPTVLSQCGNLFLFRNQNADDVRHVLDMSSASDLIMRTKMHSLARGECLCCGDMTNFPLVCKISRLDSSMAEIENRVGIRLAKETAETSGARKTSMPHWYDRFRTEVREELVKLQESSAHGSVREQG